MNQALKTVKGIEDTLTDYKDGLLSEDECLMKVYETVLSRINTRITDAKDILSNYEGIFVEKDGVTTRDRKCGNCKHFTTAGETPICALDSSPKFHERVGTEYYCHRHEYR